jgi:L-cystine uptake protein TcyP (sodium:dicarboxylate symporter family)
MGVAIGSLIGTELADLYGHNLKKPMKPVKKESRNFMSIVSRFYLKCLWFFDLTLWFISLFPFFTPFNGNTLMKTADKKENS